MFKGLMLSFKEKRCLSIATFILNSKGTPSKAIKHRLLIKKIQARIKEKMTVKRMTAPLFSLLQPIPRRNSLMTPIKRTKKEWRLRNQVATSRDP